MSELWRITENAFDPQSQHHKETIFTIGNGYLSTRGAFEEGFPGDHRATLVHGVFDVVPVVVTELANAPDWLPLVVLLNGERFSMASGTVESFVRTLDLATGVLRREVRWRSPSGVTALIEIERFASLADQHVMLIRCRVTPEFRGEVEIHASVNGNMDNEGFLHWDWLAQGCSEDVVYLLNQTRQSKIRLATSQRLDCTAGEVISQTLCDRQCIPTQMVKLKAEPGKVLTVDKVVAVFTSRDTDDVVSASISKVNQVVAGRVLPGGRILPGDRILPGWEAALVDNGSAWAKEWERTDVVIEGDDEAQISVRFNLFQMLIAAPRLDDRVNIGARTLSGFGYRGHTFWDTEVFMLPFFIYTSPHIARNLLNYRYWNLPAAREKARQKGYEGAQFPWESADTGEEVTPDWIPDFTKRSQRIRIWSGDLEIHISADIAYAVEKYWRITGDDTWMEEKGAELVLDTAKFWASRAEWNATKSRFEYTDVIGPDEYHDHVDNNAFTNRMAQWNILTALEVLDWLKTRFAPKYLELVDRLDLSADRLDGWKKVAAQIFLPRHLSDGSVGVIEQFEGYFNRTDVDLQELHLRDKSIQGIFGIEGIGDTQVLKQPDVLMLLYLLRPEFSEASVSINYDYYTQRTDHTFGSSLGPSIQAIMACEAGFPDEAYEHFIRAAHTDLRDICRNAGDGIHAASAAGTWQTVVFGFGGLNVTAQAWQLRPRLPKGWRRLAFKFFHHGQMKQVDLRQPGPIQGFIFDLDGVLTDTAEYHYLAWKQLADEEGILFDREDNEALRGVSRRESLNLLLKGRQISEVQAHDWMERKNQNYRSMLLKMTPVDLLPGALELLHELRQAGLGIAIASASRNAADVLDRLLLRESIDVLCDGNSVAQPKPAPDLFLFAAQQLGLPPESCVVVEDAEAGIEAAIAAGMRSVGLGPQARVGKASLVLPSLAGQKLAVILEKLA